MKRYWWIISLLVGVGAAGTVYWRISEGKNEIPRAQLEKSLESLQQGIKEGKSSKAPLSKRWMTLADNALAPLRRGEVAAENVPGQKRIAGYAMLQAGRSLLQEAFDGDGNHADPSPERYVQGFERMEDAIRTGYLDVPNPDSIGGEEAYQRYLSFASDAFVNGAAVYGGKPVVAPQPIDIQKRFELVLDDKGAVISANPKKLWEIGVRYFEEGDAPNWYDVKAGAVMSEPQMRFLGERAAIQRDVDEMNLRLAHRFAELERPEYAWQYYSVLFEDRYIGYQLPDRNKGAESPAERMQREGAAPIRLRSLLGRVFDARRDQMQLLAALAEASEEDAPQRSQQLAEQVENARATYNEAFQRYESEVVGAVTNVIADRDTLTELWRSINRKAEIAEETEEELLSFDSEEYRESIRHLFEDEDALQSAVEREQQNIQRKLLTLNESMSVRHQRLAKGLNTLREFTQHVKVDTPDLAMRYELFANGGLSQQAFVDLLRSAPKLKQLIEAPLRNPQALANIFAERSDIADALRVDERYESLKPILRDELESSGVVGITDESLRHAFYLNLYNEALRSFPMLELNILRTRVARLLGDAHTASRMAGDETRLGEIEANVELVRAVALDPALIGFEMPEQPRDKPAYAVPASEFLEALVKHFNRGAQSGIQVVVGEQMLNRQLELEMRDFAKAVVAASFEHAELQYQLTLDALSKITSRGNQSIPASMARAFGEEHRRWEARARAAHQQGLPQPTKDFMDGEDARRKYGPLLMYYDMEMDYRRQRERAEAAYSKFLNSPEGLIRRRAKFGLVSLALDDIMYNYDWRWRFGFGRDPLDSVDSDARPYGIFAWVEGMPEKVPATKQHGDLEGRWLREDRAVPYYQTGVPLEEARDLQFQLEELRTQVTHSEDPHLYVASRIRSGQLMEFLIDRSATAQPRARGSLNAYYLGDLPGAIRDFYLPLLNENYFNEQDPNEPTGVMRSQAYIVRNRYIPLDDHFRRVNQKIQRMLDEVDEDVVFDDNFSAIELLFDALSPNQKDENQAALIADFYDRYYRAVLQHSPALLDLPEAKYALYYRMGQLSETNAAQLLDRITSINRDVVRAKVSEARANTKQFFRQAGATLREYNNEFPNATGEAQRKLQIGDAYFASGDYVYAVEAYTDYFERRRSADTQEQRAELVYVANRIGEAFMELGSYEGSALREALASGNPAAVSEQTDPETMSLDGAIPAFSWVVRRTRNALGRTGDGGFASNRLPPVGALDAFNNLARAKTEQAKLVIGRDQQRAKELLEEAVDLLQRDIIQGDIFPEPMPGFNHSLTFRDASYLIGVAELELAQAEIAPEGGVSDYAEFRRHLDAAQRSLYYLTQNWADPVNRGVYERALQDELTFNDAVNRASRQSGQFEDDIYYLATYYMAEVAWQRANMNPKPRSEETIDALNEAIPRLEVLLEELSRVWDKDRPIAGTARTFPELDRDTRFRLADALFLRARTKLKQQEQGGSVMRSELLREFRDAAQSYSSARSSHPHTYQAAWSYIQEYESRNQLGLLGVADEATNANNMLARADTFLSGLPDSDFDMAPDAMTRQAFQTRIDWIRSNAAITTPTGN